MTIFCVMRLLVLAELLLESCVPEDVPVFPAEELDNPDEEDGADTLEEETTELELDCEEELLEPVAFTHTSVSKLLSGRVQEVWEEVVASFSL